MRPLMPSFHFSSQGLNIALENNASERFLYWWQICDMEKKLYTSTITLLLVYRGL